MTGQNRQDRCPSLAFCQQTSVGCQVQVAPDAGAGMACGGQAQQHLEGILAEVWTEMGLSRISPREQIPSWNHRPVTRPGLPASSLAF